MNDQRGPVAVEAAGFSLRVDTALPPLFDEYVARAAMVDLVDLDRPDGGVFFLAEGRVEGWPRLVVAFRHHPSGAGFTPGVLLVPETGVLFVGAGERLFAYFLGDAPRRLWADAAEAGFWGWQRHGSLVVMEAELELAVWDISGQKLWTTYVEPPWTYSVSGGLIHLDVMGTAVSFPMETGPRWDRLPWATDG